jgi:hypothetical protein
MVYLLRYRGLAYAFKPIVATGGTITNGLVDGILYRYHSFLNVGSFTFTVTDSGSDRFLEYLVVAGGGGGGYGIGGAAGGVIQNSQLIDIGSYSLSVGNGGRGADGRAFDVGTGTPTGPNFTSSPGETSTFLGQTANGGAGGNQGGVSGNGFGPGTATCGGGAGGSAAPGVGYTGGNGVFFPDWAFATSTGHNNGYYAGGGGGSGQNCVAEFGFGGLGGGGRGARGSGGDEDLRQDSPTAAVARTGSGGGAGFVGPESFIRAGASGASGLVIVRYPLAVIPN